MKFVGFYPDLGPDPEPQDIERERSVLRRLIADVERDELIEISDPSELTPWIAFQFGCWTSYLIEEGDIPLACRVGRASVVIARAIESPDREAANRISYAGALLAVDELEGAEEQYRAVLDSLYDRSRPFRSIAHMNLSMILPKLGRQEDATRHAEIGLRLLGGQVTDEVRQQGLLELLPFYKESEDLAGLWHCMMQLSPEPPPPEAVLGEFAGDMPRSAAMRIATRLEMFGEIEIARAFRLKWKEWNGDVRRGSS